MEVDCHSIRNILESRVISLPHISFDLQVADIFTKAMIRQRHQFLVGKLLLIDLPASIREEMLLYIKFRTLLILDIRLSIYV
jgi:hypothetical protein